MSVFTDLTDVPNSYSGEAGKYTKVNAGETAIVFCDPSTDHAHTFLSLTDTPANYTDDAKKIVRVNDAETDLQFGGDVLFANNEKIKWEDAAVSLEISTLWVDTGDNTCLNAMTGEKILFKIGGSQKAQLSEDGFLGIGATPAVKLHVKDTSVTCEARIESDGDNAQIVLDCASGYDDYIYFKEAGAQTWRLGADLGGSEFFELYSYDGAGQMLKVVDAGGSPSFTFFDSVFVDAPVTIDYDGPQLTFEEQGTGNDIAFDRDSASATLRLMEKISGVWKHIWQSHIQTVGTAHPVLAFDAGAEYTYTDLHCYSTDYFKISAYGDIKLIANDGNPGGYITLYSVKDTTGDPTGAEGMIYINAYDNEVRMYADGAWRTLTSW